MPRRAYNVEQGSFETSLTAPKSDIPWFANFGKFVDNPEFFAYQGRNSSPRLLQSDSYEMINASETSSQLELFDDMEIASVPTANSLNVPAHNGISNNVMQLKPSHRRASSEAVLPTTSSHGLGSQIRARKVSRPSRSSRADEEAPKTLGAILRRMVSFDQYSTRNLSREQEQLGPMYGKPRNSRDTRFRMASDNPHLFPTDQSDMLPPTVPLDESDDGIDHMPQQTMEYSATARDTSSFTAQVKRVGYGGRHCDSEPPKTLGAILRRMVSFDQYSKRTLSRAHEAPIDGRDANMRSGVPMQEARRSRKRGDDLDAQVRSMRRW